MTFWCKWVLLNYTNTLQQCSQPIYLCPRKYSKLEWTLELKLREKLLNLIKDNLILLTRNESLRFKCKWRKYKVTQLISSEVKIRIGTDGGAHISEHRVFVASSHSFARCQAIKSTVFAWIHIKKLNENFQQISTVLKFKAIPFPYTIDGNSKFSALMFCYSNSRTQIICTFCISSVDTFLIKNHKEHSDANFHLSHQNGLV